MQIILRFLNRQIELITAALIIIIALYFLLWPIKIENSAMENTISDGNWLLTSRFAAMISDPKEGELVLYKPVNDDNPVVKRVIALPGDRVQIANGVVSVNGIVLDEDYALTETAGEIDTVVGTGCFYALGDNRNMSIDSRNYGAVPTSRIKAKVLFKPSPIKEFAMY